VHVLIALLLLHKLSILFPTIPPFIHGQMLTFREKKIRSCQQNRIFAINGLLSKTIMDHFIVSPHK
jgi:hypothetical protein